MFVSVRGSHGACRVQDGSRFLAHSCGYGDSGDFGIPGSKQVHGAALDVQMSSAGRNEEASSKVGKRIEVKAGLDSPRVNNGLPQLPQKLRIVARPLLPRTA